jgi:tetrapyrrole methylase family protein/MazG family protein
MNELTQLMSIADRLLGPDGCSWDKEQTLFTLQPYLLEETHELIEAIDSQDPQKIADELGDVLFALVFISKLGEAQKTFTMQDSIKLISEKLIRRHPHVFGDVKVSSNQEIIDNWDTIKKTEKAHEARKSLFDGIPETLPAMPKAQKMAKKIQKKNRDSSSEITSEERVGEELWKLIYQCQLEGIDAESALRRHLIKVEELEG